MVCKAAGSFARPPTPQLSAYRIPLCAIPQLLWPLCHLHRLPRAIPAPEMPFPPARPGRFLPTRQVPAPIVPFFLQLAHHPKAELDVPSLAHSPHPLASLREHVPYRTAMPSSLTELRARSPGLVHLPIAHAQPVTVLGICSNNACSEQRKVPIRQALLSRR